ncbi:MAG: OmpA family protein [Rhodocyclaceae bacterium]|nr:MAG: OmpA family protein [Rhodocyclaceae bacterium]
MPKSHLQIYSNARNTFRLFTSRLSCIAALSLNAVLLVSAATAAEHIRVRHAQDTWESSASNDSAYFDAGSSSIDDAASQLIQRHGDRLRAAPEFHITIIAHTDDLGSSSFEIAKGQERLDAVRKRLEELGVPPGRIRSENHGSESRSAELCAEEECRRSNRRVDFLFSR